MNNDKMKIFLVDDDAVFVNSLKTNFLKHADLEIETFGTGDLCLENLSLNPDVIFLDHQLSGMDKNAMNGIEVLDKIKAINPDIPVVLLSKQDKIDLAIEGLQSQAFDYVMKSESTFDSLQKIITDVYFNHKIQEEMNALVETM